MKIQTRESILDIVIAEGPPELEEIDLIPIEAHIGAQEFDEEKFLEWLRWIKENDQAFVVFMGDNFEFATRDSVGDVYTQKKPPEGQMEWAVEILTPLANANKILGMLSGNHEERCYRATGIDPTKWVARVLGVPYFSDGQGVLKIRFGRGANGKPIAYTVHLSHGRSGARTPGGKLNAAWRATDVVWNADVYLVGHTHGLLTGRQDRLEFDERNNNIRREKYYVVVAGSFLQYASYSKKAVWAPLGTGAPRVRLNGRRRDIHVSI